MAAGGTRRALLRLLAGGALGGLVARLGLAEAGEAKAKNERKRRKPDTRSRPAGGLQAEAKRNKRKKRDKKPKPPPCDELEPTLCGACEEAICVAGDWACKVLGDTDCGGGVCVWEGECCPGQKKCPGYTECFAAEDCCPGALPPLCEPCEKVVCEGGGLVCRPKSAVCPYPEDQEVCCNGDLVCRGRWDLPEQCATYTPERTYNPGNCRCQCPPDTNESLGLCCPLGYHSFPASNGECCRWEDCGGYQCSRCVCALGFSLDQRNQCVRTT
jgi:hypothetical protein